MKANKRQYLPPARPISPAEPKLALTIETVTPDTAFEYLATAGKNRRISGPQVNKWAKAMRAGQWRLTGDPIRFDITGALIDGQHRLTAVINSGVPIEVAVARNCALDVFPVLDDGKRRSGADVLSIMGDVDQVQATAAALKIIKAYALSYRSRTPMLTTMAAGRLANWEIGHWYEEHSAISDWIALGVRMHRRIDASSSSSAIAAALYLGSLLHFARTLEFAEALASGEGLHKDEGPLLLMNRSRVTTVNNSGETGQAVTFILTAKALNLWWAGKTQANLPFSANSVPDLGNPVIPRITLDILAIKS